MTTPLLQNILDQAKSLRGVADYQFGEGRAAIEEVAATIRKSKKVVLSGMGASCFACIPLQGMLLKSGYDATCIEAAELLYFRPPYFGDGTALVLVSRSGESIEITKLLEDVSKLGTSVTGIVNVPGSSLCTRARHSIVLGSAADQLVAIQTYTATLAILALIHAAVEGELDKARVELDETISQLQRFLPAWVEGRSQWQEFLGEGGPLYVLGRGTALGAVAEGVLLMHETAKAPAVGMSVPQFRHGPVEVVDKDFRAVVVGTQPETEELDAMLANDLIGMRAQVRWIGPAREGCVAEPLCEWPGDVPARFTSLVETIPLQIAAYKKAELQGVTPGDFRWAPAVTNTEAGFLNS